MQQRVDNWIDPFRDPLGAGYQTVQALYAFARGGVLGVGLGAGLPTIGGRLPVPAVHTDYPLAALGEELGLIGLLAILGLYLVVVERGLRIAAAAHDEFRALLAAGLALVVGRPGVHHRRGQPQAHPAHRDHAAADLVRRLVAAGERAGDRAAAGPVRPGRRAAASRRGRLADGLAAMLRRNEASAMSAAPVRRPIGGNIWRTGVALAAAFATLAVGAGWWQVVDAQRLSREPDNPAVIAVARRALRGPIVDRDGRWLARSTRDANGEAVREYRDDSISHVVGYASRQYGTAGLERAYNAELIGLGGSDPFAGLLDKFDASRRSPLGLQTTLDLRLQHAAIEGLGRRPRRGRDARPVDGRRPRPRLDPDLRRRRDRGPGHRRARRSPRCATTSPTRCCRARRWAATCRARCSRSSPAIAGLNTGSIAPDTTFPQQPKAEDKGLLVEGFRIKDGHHPQTGNTPLDFTGRDRGQLQHLVRAGRARDRRRRPRRPGGPAGLRRADPVRPADGREPGDQRRAASAPGGFSDDVELASASFGQGETFVTPLQMALVASTVANDGVLMHAAPRDAR